MNDSELRDAAVAELKKTTQGYLKSNGDPRTTVGAQWKKGLDLLAQIGQAAPPPTGDKFAAPNGNDANAGTLSSPYLTVQKLQTSLLPGQTGMLRGGTYGSLSTWHNLTKSGTAAGRITITNYPGERVTIKGAVFVEGNFVTVRNLHFDHSNNRGNVTACGNKGANFWLIGNDIIFEYNEVYFSDPFYRTSGLLTGDAPNAIYPQGRGHRLIVRYNRIHDFGGCHAYDHGIYLGYGDRCQVYGNWWWQNPNGWGLHFYPGASNCVGWGNVLSRMGMGSVFGDEAGYGYTSNNNTIYNNVFIDLLRATSAGGYRYAGAANEGATPIGGGNVFRDNCAWNCPGGIGGQANVTVSGNIVANPLFVNAAANDYRLTASSPAALKAYGLPDFIPGPTV